MNENLMKELANVMVESEFMINRKKIFKDQKYIIIISKEKGVIEKFDIETKFSIMKNSVNKQTANQKIFVSEMRKRLEDKIKDQIITRAENLESNTLKQIFSLSEKMDETEIIHNNIKMVFDAIKNKN